MKPVSVKLGFYAALASCIAASGYSVAQLLQILGVLHFPWDAILGSEIAGDFNPKPRVYLSACEAFDLPPGDCMMVAAHSNDLSHAAQCGLRTGHIGRPNEHGPGKGEAAPTIKVDAAGVDLEDLASTLGL